MSRLIVIGFIGFVDQIVKETTCPTKYESPMAIRHFGLFEEIMSQSQ